MVNDAEKAVTFPLLALRFHDPDSTYGIIGTGMEDAEDVL